MNEPSSPRLERVKSRIAPESWQRRLAQARADEAVIVQILDEVERGVSLNDSIRSVVRAPRRSWAMRRVSAYRDLGLEGLIDARTPREPKVSRACRQTVQAARAANPHVTTTEVLTILQAQHISPLPSESTIKREFARVDGRRKHAARKERTLHEVVELSFAGGELLLAAEAETGAIAALTSTVMRMAKAAQAASQGRTAKKDVAFRDRRGRFTARYNRRRRRKRNEEIASYLRPAAEKAVGRVPAWPRFVREGAQSIDAKLRMLTFGWLFAETKGWAALRAPNAAGLGVLTGFAYMPSTLAKLVSALAISGAGESLLKAVGQHWHGVAEKHFSEPGAMATFYVDNHAKEVWSSLFTQSGKVSHRNRVMPCITTTYVHTGAGTPAVMSVQSGSAPLAPRLIELVEEAETLLAAEIERAVVIDAEGSTFDILESFIERGRVLVTPLRPTRAPDLELRFSRGSYFRPYRDNDELRVATCTLRHKSSGRTLDLGALLVRREHRRNDTILLTNGLDFGLEGRELADLYFRRWPIQENAFKDGVVLGLNQHRGNCGRMVANVAVVTELEKLAARVQRDGATLARLLDGSAPLATTAMQTAKADRRAQNALATRRRRLDALVTRGQTSGRPFARVALDHRRALARGEDAARAAAAAGRAWESSQQRRAKLERGLVEMADRQRHLEKQRTIRQLDVDQDRILTASKLTALQLMSFATRVYLTDHIMTPETFVSRVFPLHGRKEIEPTVERIVFYENPRDPEINTTLHNACRRLNRRELKRDGRRLRYTVEVAPADARSS